MLRSLLLFLSIAAITVLEFTVYPGHTYLAGESQYLVPMMERLHLHGFLSRDLAAINPTLTFTIFDEVTLFLVRTAHQSFERALAVQQLTFRFAGLLGLVFLGLSTRIRPVWSLLFATLISALVQLPGPAISLTGLEPTPFAFSLSLTLLGLGCLAREKPLAAGLFGGIALAYDPPVGMVFWVLVLGGLLFRPALRPLLRPTLPALLVFSLLLGNAAQLQPGRGEALPAFAHVSNAWFDIQSMRTPEVYPLTWGWRIWAFYFLLASAGVLAVTRMRGLLGSSAWLFYSLLLVGLASLPATTLLFAISHWAWLAAVEPARSLVFTVVSALVVCSAYAVHAWHEGNYRGLAYLLPVVILPLVFHRPPATPQTEMDAASIDQISSWAQQKTWGGSMFLFPDAGRSPCPGRFRGEAVRAVYVDWISGNLVKEYPAFAADWYERWQLTMAVPYSPGRLQSLLTLPMEYVVLRRNHALARIQPEFVTPSFLVYDFHTLQIAPKPLQSSDAY